MSIYFRNHLSIICYFLIKQHLSIYKILVILPRSSNTLGRKLEWIICFNSCTMVNAHWWKYNTPIHKINFILISLFPIDFLVANAVAPSSRQSILEEDARKLREIITRLSLLRVDHTEHACLKALVLFKAGISYYR